MKSTRFSRPMGHLGTGLTFGLLFGLLVFATATMMGKPWLGLAALGWTVAVRVFQCVLVGWYVVKDRNALRLAWLYPLRDLLGSLLWMASYASRRVGWRDDFFELRKRGLMRLIPGEEHRAGAHQ